ncbi:MAG: hypothetical protein IPK42_05635 [Betaproteobacteria bacterium]|nr:hypothetical protein [Betaproteobacteria bacterium]
MKAFSLSASLAVSIAGLVFSGATLAQSTWDWRGTRRGAIPTWGTVSARRKRLHFLRAVNDVDRRVGHQEQDNSTTGGVQARTQPNTQLSRVARLMRKCWPSISTRPLG